MPENVVLITADSLRFDHISHGNENPYQNVQTTPFLDSLFDDNISFNKHYSTGSGTSTSFPGLLLSSLPLDYGYAGVNDHHVPIAEVLQSNGIQTIGITAQTSCSSIYGYHRGFDHFVDWTKDDRLIQNKTDFDMMDTIKQFIRRYPALHNIASKLKRVYSDQFPTCPYHQATDVTDAAISLLDGEVDIDEQFFLWVHYMEPHAPYFPPPVDQDAVDCGDWDIQSIQQVFRKADEVYSPPADGSTIHGMKTSEIAGIRDFYAASVKYLDREIERLFEGLRRRNLIDTSTIIISSDHGEELFDHGDFTHRPKLYEELIHVPLVLIQRHGEVPPEDTISALTSHLDIPPTIASLFGVDYPDAWRGIPLISGSSITKGHENVISELCHISGLGGSIDLDELVVCVRKGEWKYIRNNQLGSNELYNIHEDPEETSNLYNTDINVELQLETLLNLRVNRVEEVNLEEGVSDTVKNRLRQLGYRE